MAAITGSTFKGVTAMPVTITRNALSASDTLTYIDGRGQILELYNTTGSPVVVTITGSTATTVAPSGYGGTVSVSAGKAVTVPATSTVAVNLDQIAAFLSGTITLTGGTGVTAHLYN
jgi:hypothetical protein